MANKIEEEMERIRAERKSKIRDAILVVAVSAVLAAILLAFKGQITGLAVAEEDAFCTDNSGFAFLSPENITLRQGGSAYQLKMSCPDGNITLQDNSDFIDVSARGEVTLREGMAIPDNFNAIIIAEEESGRITYKKFNFEAR